MKHGQFRAGRRLAFIAGLGMLACCIGAQSGRAQVGARLDSTPTRAYYLHISQLYDGDYRDALRGFQADVRGGIKTPQSRWIDSICYYAMVGETYYQMGEYAEALQQYTAALKLYSAFSNWMLRVQFPRAIPPDNSTVQRQIPWRAPNSRPFRLGDVPDSMNIGQGRLDNELAVRQGGVVQQAMLMPIHVHEIVRCTALALRRRHELMGPICKLDPLTGEVLAKLQQRPGPQNWSEAWIDLQLGLAYACAGENAQAITHLKRSLLLGGEYDHPLTTVALLELGRLAMEAGHFDAALQSFAEASYAAVYAENAGALEEAFRLGAQAHLISNQQGLYPPLAHAQRWAQTKRLTNLRGTILLLAAENYAALGDTQSAASAATDARRASRRDMPAGTLGDRLSFVQARIHYQRGEGEAGNEALASALTSGRSGSKRLLQISLANRLFHDGTLSSRVAVDLYQQLLADPLPADWSHDCQQVLMTRTADLELAYENWFRAALDRKENELALHISDLARRHRFHRTLPLGGRLLALRWILESPAKDLPQQAGLQRQDLEVRYPNFVKLAQRRAELQRELKRQPLAPVDQPAQRRQQEMLKELAKIGQAQEAILRPMALSREPSDLVFPPVFEHNEVQKSLPPGHALLAFFTTSDGATYGFMLSQDRYAIWPLGKTADVHKSVAALLQGLGNYGPNRPISLEDLQDPAWQKAGRQCIQMLFRDSGVDLSDGIDELVIVPDGPLWYLPFEALPLKGGRPLVSRYRIRYAPTISLALPQSLPHGRPANAAVVRGRLSTSDADEAMATFALQSLQRVLPNASGLERLPAGSSLFGTVVDRLIVLDQIDIEPEAPYDWSPMPSPSERRHDDPLARWFPLPWGAPEQVVLPGFHTAAEDGLKKRPQLPPGREVFLALCGLMSGGSRTVLISRWRNGGQTCYELVREFARELPFTTASEAWQRSVELATGRPLEWENEPRLRRYTADQPPQADHPLFWAGYMLVDTGHNPAAEPTPEEEPVLQFKDNKPEGDN